MMSLQSPYILLLFATIALGCSDSDDSGTSRPDASTDAEAGPDAGSDAPGGCFYNGQWYAEGQTVPDPDARCVCRNGQVGCIGGL
jgi:hypothetical protein